MPDIYSPADEPRKIGHQLIKKHHDHLSGRRVDFLFVERKDKDGNSQAITKGVKNHYGQAKLVTNLNAYLAGDGKYEPQPFFVILITKHFWTNASDLFKQALVDHELCHCEYDSETDKYSTVDHDVTEFVEIVKRWGLWSCEVEAFVKAAKQQSLAFDNESQPQSASEAEPATGNGGGAAERSRKVHKLTRRIDKAKATEILGG
jgi:hypothetical protein